MSGLVSAARLCLRGGGGDGAVDKLCARARASSRIGRKLLSVCNFPIADGTESEPKRKEFMQAGEARPAGLQTVACLHAPLLPAFLPFTLLRACICRPPFHFTVNFPCFLSNSGACVHATTVFFSVLGCWV